MKKTISIFLASLCLLACAETEIETVVRQVEPEKPSAIHYYYSRQLGATISPAKLGYTAATFTPGCTFVYGDTIFIANTQKENYSVELYSVSAQKKITSLKTWTYNGENQSFNGIIEAIAVSNGRLYLGNRGACIDVFDLKTLEFITRIGNRVLGETDTQLPQVYAMAIVDDYIVVRTRTRLQVMLQSEVTAENYQNVSFYARSNTDGFDENVGSYSHQMTVDSLGMIYLADNGELGNCKICVIDPGLIKKGDNLVLTNDQTLDLPYPDYHFPRGIALYKHLMYIARFDGSIYVYNRTKKEFSPDSFRAVPGYTFTGLQKLFMAGDRLWVSDIRTKEVVGIDMYCGSIEEYD